VDGSLKDETKRVSKAMSENGKAMKYIKNPTEKVQSVAK